MASLPHTSVVAAQGFARVMCLGQNSLLLSYSAASAGWLSHCLVACPGLACSLGFAASSSWRNTGGRMGSSGRALGSTPQAEPQNKGGTPAMPTTCWRGLLRQGYQIQSLTLEPAESIRPFWEVLMGDFGKKIPHSPEP